MFKKATTIRIRYILESFISRNCPLLKYCSLNFKILLHTLAAKVHCLIMVIQQEAHRHIPGDRSQIHSDRFVKQKTKNLQSQKVITKSYLEEDTPNNSIQCGFKLFNLSSHIEPFMTTSKTNESNQLSLAEVTYCLNIVLAEESRIR